MRLYEFDQKDKLSIMLNNATRFSEKKLLEFKKLVDKGILSENEFISWANDQIDKELNNE